MLEEPVSWSSAIQEKQPPSTSDEHMILLVS